MHDARALLQILDGLGVFLAVDVENGPIKVEIFLIENVLLVVVGIILAFLVFVGAALVEFVALVAGKLAI
jgi:hypothetical protein